MIFLSLTVKAFYFEFIHDIILMWGYRIVLTLLVLSACFQDPFSMLFVEPGYLFVDCSDTFLLTLVHPSVNSFQ